MEPGSKPVKQQLWNRAGQSRNHQHRAALGQPRGDRVNVPWGTGEGSPLDTAGLILETSFPSSESTLSIQFQWFYGQFLLAPTN